MAARSVHLYVLDTFADWEPSYAAARLNDPAWQRDPGRYRVRTVADNWARVRSMGGLSVVPDLVVEDLNPATSALLILPGANSWEAGAGEAVVVKAAEFLAAGVPVAAICGATYGLAAAGLLDERRHTSNSLEFLQGAPGYGGARHYVEARAVADRGLITAPAVGAVEFAAAIFQELEVFEPELIEGWVRLFAAREPVAAG
ncbi:MAG TPA: type 1 glutamine amidotransferase family protein [Candidatus Dormibacteraeota bacterium]